MCFRLKRKYIDLFYLIYEVIKYNFGTKLKNLSISL